MTLTLACSNVLMTLGVPYLDLAHREPYLLRSVFNPRKQLIHLTLVYVYPYSGLPKPSAQFI